MNRFITIVLIFFLSCSRVENNSIENLNTEQLINLIVDTYAAPIKPPPPRNISKEELKEYVNKIKIESKNKSLNVSVYKVLEPLSLNLDSFKNKNLILDELLPRLGLFNSKKHIEFKIKETRGNKIHYLDSKKTKDDIFKKNDLVIRFSRIIFNSDYSKAMIAVTFQRGKNDGFSSLYVLVKKNKKWTFEFNKLLMIS